MTHQKTLNDRVIEAKFMASLSKIESRDKKGRVKAVLVPASNATFNRVIIRRYAGGIITTECHKCSGHAGYADCLGNKNGVCRHSMAAMFVAMGDQGYTPRFRRDYYDAERFAYKNATHTFSDPDTGLPLVLNVTSHQGQHAHLYFVALENEAVKLEVKKAA